MTSENTTSDQAKAADSGDARSAAQRRLDHLFRHTLLEGQVSPLYFLLQRFRSRAEEVA